MKNIYYKELKQDTASIEISGDTFHHFKNVLRGKKNEEVQVFNGSGLIGKGRVTELSKREMLITLACVDEKAPYSSPVLILGIPKKEYLESIIRSAIQIGVSKIKLVTTEYTPWKYKQYDRLDKIMEAALIQSENPYLPELEVYSSLEELLLNLSEPTLAFSTEVKVNANEELGKVENLLIGPEGGFSESEIKLLMENQKILLKRCDIPIMKAEVAVPFGLGLIHKS